MDKHQFLEIVSEELDAADINMSHLPEEEVRNKVRGEN